MLLPAVLAAISVFAGGPATVQCQASLGSDAGLAFPAERRIELVSRECQQLNWMVRHRRLPLPHKEKDGSLTGVEPEWIQSLVVAVHEAGHLRYPNSSEGCVQRYALRHVKLFAKRFRFSKRDLATVVWESDYWIDNPIYRTCDA